MSTQTILPLAISIAPFPEGFQGDMDETFQQAVILMEAYIEGNFLTGLILPPGSTLPSSDQGPIAMGGVWYFWSSATGSYQPQSVPVKLAKNFCRNPVYQVAQNGSSFSATPVPVTPTFDCAQFKASIANVISVSSVAGPAATADNDNCPTAAQYTVATVVASLASTDIFSHEHFIEGSDLVGLEGEALSLGFSFYTNQAGVYSAYLTSSGHDQSYVFSFQVTTINTWIRIKVQGIPPLPTSGTWHYGEGQTGLYLGITLGCGTQWQTANTASWQSAFLAGTSSNTNLLATVGNLIAVSAIKLEASATCTPITVSSFGDDYESVLRYFFTNFTYQTLNAGVPIQLRAPSAGTWQASLLFPRRMCKAPTVTPYGSTSFAKGYITNVSKGGAVDIAVATILAKQKGIFDTEAATPPSGSPTASGTVTAITFTANTTNLQSTITNVTPAEAEYLLPGATVSGTGIQAGSTVLSYNSALQTLYISLPATATGTNVSLTFSSPIIASMSTLVGIAIGQPISGTGAPSGTTVQAILSSNSILASNPITPGTATFTFGGGVINLHDQLLC